MESTVANVRARISSDDCSATYAWKLGDTKQLATDAMLCATIMNCQLGAHTYIMYPMRPAMVPMDMAWSRPMESEMNPPSI